MDAEKIVSFVKEQIEPLPAYPPYGERYRVSATLIDGTRLPCVVIEGTAKIVDLAIKRFEETRQSTDPFMGYHAIVKSFVTKGGTVNNYDLKDISASPFAIPVVRVREIDGETSMSWTEFYAIMRDGKEFRFGTTFLTEFFEMPIGYAATDITRIIPAVRGEKPRQEYIYREKPFFTCYVDGL